MNLKGAFFDNKKITVTSKKLGEGQFGKVYIVGYNKEGEKNAAKIIKNDFELNVSKQMILLREIVILYKMKHPAISQFYGINFHTFDNPYNLELTIITEYYSQGSLKSILKKEQDNFVDDNWTPTKKYFCLIGIADAMRYLHEYGIVHQDLKPENILIDEN